MPRLDDSSGVTIVIAILALVDLFPTGWECPGANLRLARTGANTTTFS